MIITEYYGTRADGVILNRTYSDSGMMIRQCGTDVLYAEAIDPADTGRVYTETEEPIAAEQEISDADLGAMVKEVL